MDIMVDFLFYENAKNEDCVLLVWILVTENEGSIFRKNFDDLYLTTRRHIPEYDNIHTHCSENLSFPIDYLHASRNILEFSKCTTIKGDNMLCCCISVTLNAIQSNTNIFL
jgi:hypothetical protein